MVDRKITALTAWATELVERKNEQASSGCSARSQKKIPKKTTNKPKLKLKYLLYLFKGENCTQNQLFHHINLHICSTFSNKNIQIHKKAFSFKHLCMMFTKNHIYVSNNQRHEWVDYFFLTSQNWSYTEVMNLTLGFGK